MTAIAYLRTVLARYNTTPILLLPLTPAYQAVAPIVRTWGHRFILNLSPSGSNAKQTAVAGSTDLDLFVSLNPSILSINTLSQIYTSLLQYMQSARYTVRRQNVSVRINHNGTEVDIVPAVKFSGNTQDHWLHVTKSGRDRTKTNVHQHIQRIVNSGRIDEIRLLKIWRKQHNLDFPSIYLEETVLNALSGYRFGNLDQNFLRVLDYLSSNFIQARVIDPANTANIISNDLTQAQKTIISSAASLSRRQPTWADIII